MRTSPLIALVSVLLLSGCKVTPPSHIEQKVVVAAEHEITVGNRSQKNPLPTNTATIAAAKKRLGTTA